MKASQQCFPVIVVIVVHFSACANTLEVRFVTETRRRRRRKDDIFRLGLSTGSPSKKRRKPTVFSLHGLALKEGCHKHLTSGTPLLVSTVHGRILLQMADVSFY